MILTFPCSIIPESSCWSSYRGIRWLRNVPVFTTMEKMHADGIKRGIWHSVDFPDAKLFPQSLVEYSLGHNKSSDCCDQIRKHLFAMGWKIERKDERAKKMSRYRYTSLDGTCYYSLNTVFLHSIVKQLSVTKSENPLEISHTKTQSFISISSSVDSVCESTKLPRRSKRGNKSSQQMPHHSRNIVENQCISTCSVDRTPAAPSPISVAKELGSEFDCSPTREHYGFMSGQEMGVPVGAANNDDISPSLDASFDKRHAIDSKSVVEDQCIGFNSVCENLHETKHSKRFVKKSNKRNSDINYNAQNKRYCDVSIESVCCPQAVIDYGKLNLNFGHLKCKKLDVDIKELISKAKMHLSFEGWRFQYVFEAKRRTLRYFSPKGEMYDSLMRACRAWKEKEMITWRCHEPNINEKPSSGIVNHQIHGDSTEIRKQDENPAVLQRSTEIRYTYARRKRKAPFVLNTCSILEERNSETVLKKSKRATGRGSFLSSLIDNGVVLLGQEVSYVQKRKLHPLAKGIITHEGIKCNCCSKIYGLSAFEVHAGSGFHRPAAHIFLKDGRSLVDCRSQLVVDGSDNICSICYNGGELMLCDNCPSAFHSSCVGLEAIPADDWHCPSCRCVICGNRDYGGGKFYAKKPMVCCRQCKREYHLACVQDKVPSTTKEDWFCSPKCSKVFAGLQKLVGKVNPTNVEGLTWTILRSWEQSRVSIDTSTPNAQTNYERKLFAASRVLQECFERMLDPLTKRETVRDVVFSRSSKLNRSNYRGFHTVILEEGNKIVTVATLRISHDIAEMPLIGTALNYRRKGMCRLLMTILEKVLASFGVKMLILPSARELLETWINSFGFNEMTRFERLQNLHHIYLQFIGTTLCQKCLGSCASK